MAKSQIRKSAKQKVAAEQGIMPVASIPSGRSLRLSARQKVELEAKVEAEAKEEAARALRLVALPKKAASRKKPIKKPIKRSVKKPIKYSSGAGLTPKEPCKDCPDQIEEA